MKKSLLITAIILTMPILFGCGQEKTQNQDVTKNQDVSQSQEVKQGQQINKQNCLADDCLLVEDIEYPVGELSTEIVEALNLAIEDEYKAKTTYEKVIEKFGSLKPFIMIVRAEESHIASLKSIYDKYGLEIPENDWSEKIEAPETFQEACATGVEAEIENARLYEEDLIPAVSDYPDITSVFNNLMEASRSKHLPAFEKCD